MTLWLIAIGSGALFAAAQYGRLLVRGGARASLLAAMRATSILLLVALVLDARVGRDRPPRPIVALDASLSWSRGDSTRWPRALARARALAGDSLLLFGDSVRVAATVGGPADHASLLGPVAGQAAAQGRPVVIVSDGESELTAEERTTLPRGSRVDVLTAAPRPDAAVVSVEAPRSLASGDTLHLSVAIRSGAAGSPAAVLSVSLGPRPLASTPVAPLPAHGATSVAVAAPLVAPEGPHVLRVIVSAPGDAERRNDTLSFAVEVSPAAGAVWVSSAPDLDGRAALSVLRETLGRSVRGYLRVAPGLWRVDGSLAPIEEAEVRAAVRDAPVLVLHGDTAVFGRPRQLAGDAPLALLPGPGAATDAAPSAAQGALDEWYPVGAPESPAARALAGVPWDSLAPVSLGAAAGLRAPVGPGAWVAVAGRRARRGEPAPFVVGTEWPRRVVVARATGLWRWRARGGAGAVAYDGLWGSLFDWLADARRDRRAALPEQAGTRAGVPVRWRLATGDSAVTVRLARRDAPAQRDSMRLRRRPGSMFAESPPLAPGVYDVTAPGGRSMLVVNEAAELLPHRPTLERGKIGEGDVASSAPPLRQWGIAYAAIVMLLCAEWLLRRQRGLG